MSFVLQIQPFVTRTVLHSSSVKFTINFLVDLSASAIGVKAPAMIFYTYSSISRMNMESSCIFFASSKRSIYISTLCFSIESRSTSISRRFLTSSCMTDSGADELLQCSLTFLLRSKGRFRHIESKKSSKYSSLSRPYSALRQIHLPDLINC